MPIEEGASAAEEAGLNGDRLARGEADRTQTAPPAATPPPSAATGYPRSPHHAAKRVPAAGDLWNAWVPYEEVNDGKDRPVLVVHVNATYVSVLMFTSKDQTIRRTYLRAPDGMLDHAHTSFLKLDRVINPDHDAFRNFRARTDDRWLASVDRAFRSVRDGGP